MMRRTAWRRLWCDGNTDSISGKSIYCSPTPGGAHLIFAELTTIAKVDSWYAVVGNKMPRWQHMSAREKPERYFHKQLTMLALALLAATAILQWVFSSQIFPEIPPLSFGEPWASVARARQMWRIRPFQNVGHVSARLFDGFDHHQAQRSRLAPFSSDWQRRTAEGNPPPNRCSERWYLGRAQFDLSLPPSFLSRCNVSSQALALKDQ